MKIRNKILITICALILLSLVCQIVFNQFLSKGFFMQQQKGIIAESFEQIKAGYSDDLDAVNNIAENLQDTYGIKTVISDNGEIVYSSGYSSMMHGQRPGMKPMFYAEFTATPTVLVIEGKGAHGKADQLQLAGCFSHNGAEIRVLMTLQIAAIDNSVSIFTEANIYISIAVLLIGILIALAVSKAISAPITDIEAVSKKIAKLDFSDTANEQDSTFEIAGLARSINQMSRQLAQNLRDLTAANEQLQRDIEYKNKIEGYRREFIASISHEMKTPLALLQIYTENLKNNIQGIDRDYYCDTIIEETEKLSKLVSDMLEISSIDNGFIKLNFEEVDLTELCRDILREYQPILSECQTKVSLEESAVVSGDIKYLEQVIKNILNNAVQHTAPGNEIRITLGSADGKACLEVFNQGEHIPEDDLEHLWDAFYRTDKARTRDEKNNVGLGLYIVKTVMDKHGGTCHIENTDGGVTVTITLN